MNVEELLCVIMVNFLMIQVLITYYVIKRFKDGYDNAEIINRTYKFNNGRDITSCSAAAKFVKKIDDYHHHHAQDIFTDVAIINPKRDCVIFQN